MSTPPVGDQPHQPSSFQFPKRYFGKNKTSRTFQAAWFKQWKWLHYCEENDVAFCFLCVKAYKEGKLSGKSSDAAFVSTGFTNWKDACVKFRTHDSSNSHKEAVEKMVTLPSTTRDIGESLSAAHKMEKSQNRQMLMKILSNVQFLARQSLPFRGDGDESESNFIQLLLLRGTDDTRVKEWVQKKTNKYTSAEIQNELIRIMALQVLREIACNLHNTPFYTIMADETTDSSNKEQFVVCIRWVDDELDIHEDFIGLHVVESIDAATLHAVLKDVLIRMNLSVLKLRGQCYDGASSMSGLKSGVATRFSEEEERAIYTHCYGHALNLACSDTIKGCKLMRDALDVTHEVVKLIKKSPRRDAIFAHLKEEMAPDTPGVRVLCPHRWTVKADSLKSILDNYVVLQKTWEESVDVVKDTEMKSRIIGVATQMETFDYLYGVMLGQMILCHSDNLSRTLQKRDISAAEGQEVAEIVVQTLQKMRTDECFHLFWLKVTKQADDLHLPEPQLPRRRKVPRRFAVGDAEPEHPATPHDHYKRIYFEALDLIINCIKSRFDQPGYRVYSQLQQLLFKAAKGEEYQSELQFVRSFYGDDFSGVLESQLQAFTHLFQQKPSELWDIVSRLRTLSRAQRDLLSEVYKLLRLILVLPATNSVSERSFSALRRVKTYLRSTMNQSRLNHLMILHVHKHLTDRLDLVKVANEFVKGLEHRLTYFGHFTS